MTLDQPKLMGIINLDAASFYDGSHALNKDSFLRKAEKMIIEGADVIDLGATTSRPGSSLSDPNDEIIKLENNELELIDWDLTGDANWEVD